eukprot:scaffold289385_cov32-Tisochrysis_lutea.AAC.1
MPGPRACGFKNAAGWYQAETTPAASSWSSFFSRRVCARVEDELTGCLKMGTQFSEVWVG